MLLSSHNISNNNVDIVVWDLDYIVNPENQRKDFLGQKLHHPFKTREIDGKYSYWDSKAKKTVTKKTKELVYTEDFLSDEVCDDILNATRFEMKHDGSCGYILYDEQTNKFVPYARYDVKKDKEGNFKSSPENSIPCEEKPTDPNATHWPHFVLCLPDEQNKRLDYKWHVNAFNLMMNSEKFKKLNELDSSQKKSFTCEFMGKKFNWKKADSIEDDAVIVPHGLIEFKIPIELRNYNGFLQIFSEIDYIEGLIVHGKNKIWKIRREMFMGNNNEKLLWPDKGERKMSEIVALK